MLTMARCGDAIRHELGLDLPGETALLECVNAAGQWFVDMHGWSWLDRTTTLNTTAAQNYVDLAGATGFRKLVRASYINWWLQHTDMAHISRLRATTISSIPSYCAVGWSIAADGALTARLELYPTPSTSVTGAIQVFYRAGWQTPQSGSDQARIAIPEHVEGLFLQVVRAYAKGLQESDVASVTARLSEIVTGAEWQAKVRADAATQTNFGPMRGSLVLGAEYDETSTWGIGLVPDP